MSIRRVNGTPAERFWPKVKKTDGCWEWQAAKQKQGYGIFGMTGHYLAHRVSWLLTHGSLDPKKDVLHKCDNPACVRPDHLFLGDDFDNQRDCLKKGRRAKHIYAIRGERNGMAKLKNDDAKTIRHLYFAERRTAKEIANFFNVNPGSVENIIYGKTFRL